MAWRDSGGDGHILHFVLDSSDMVIYILYVKYTLINKDQCLKISLHER